MGKLSDAFENRDYYISVMELITLSNKLSEKQENEWMEPFIKADPLPFCTDKTAPSGTSAIAETSYMTYEESEVTAANMGGAAQLFGLSAEGSAVSTSGFMAPTGSLFIKVKAFG